MARRKSNTLSVGDLEQSFREKNFLPLYLFSGDEDFLIQEALDVLIHHAIDESSRPFDLDILYGGDVDVRDVVSRASSFPMVGERRIVIVRDGERLTSTDASREILLRYLQNPSPSTIFVFIVLKADMRLNVFKAFDDQGAAVTFRSLYENEVPSWVMERVKKLKHTIAPEAAQVLQSYVGTSLRTINNELEKLLLYIGNRSRIEVDDVNAVVGMSKTYNVFELQKTIGVKNRVRSLEIAERMLDTGESPIGIVVMLTRYFQKLWIVPALQRKSHSEYEMASALGVSRYYVKEYVAAAERFSREEVEKAFRALLEADHVLKTSGGEPRLVLTLLVHQLVSGG